MGLLTNVYPRMLDEVKKRKILPPIQWDVVVDSSVVGYQKPDPKIFEIAQKMAGVDKSNILFVENSIENIDAAKVLGWNTFHYDSIHIEISNTALLRCVG
jgi:putative hydrolase of the HAD superfamily